MTICKGITVMIIGSVLPVTAIGVFLFVVYYMVMDHVMNKLWA